MAGGRGQHHLAANYFLWPLRGYFSRSKISVCFGPSLRYGRERCAGLHRAIEAKWAAQETGDFAWRPSRIHQKDGKFKGKIHTLALCLNGGILPKTNISPDTPAYRALAGMFALGAGWE